MTVPVLLPVFIRLNNNVLLIIFADLSEWHTDTSALALLDGSVYWDMHRPLTENCTLEVSISGGSANHAREIQILLSFLRFVDQSQISC